LYKNKAFSLDTGSKDNDIRFMARNNYVNIYTTTDVVQPDTWQYLTITYNGTYGLFVDGEKTAVKGTPPTITANDYDMQISRDSATTAMQGRLDEIRISDSTLSEEYIKTSYNNQKNPGLSARVGGVPFTAVFSPSTNSPYVPL